MIAPIRHRGPDAEGVHVDTGIALGVRRLSIIDVAGGHQPVSGEDGAVTVACNGEIYNHVELREELVELGHRFRTSSDVEVVAHLYEEHGLDCLHRLRGMFALAIWDRERRRLILARDRLGIKPLCYAETNDGLLFASEQKAILAAGDVSRALDPAALGDVLAMGFVLAPKTMLASVRRLAPGQYLMYGDGQASVGTWWDLAFPHAGSHERRSAASWAEELRAKLYETVRLHLRSDVPVGAWLSPGLDSSSIVALIAHHGLEPLPTFSIGFDEPSFDEVGRSRLLTDFNGYSMPNEQVTCTEDAFELLPRVVWHCEDPQGTAVEIPQLLLAELTARSVKVVLCGEGADEALGGYPWTRVEAIVRPLRILPPGVRRLLARALPERRFSRVRRNLFARGRMRPARYARLLDSHEGDWAGVLAPDLRNRLRACEEPGDAVALPEDYLRWHPFDRMQYLETKMRLPDKTTRHLDAVTMACSLEARVPFLDHELYELCARIPPWLKLRRLEEKYVLRQAMVDVIPDEIRRRRKRGLSAPFVQWTRRLPEFAIDLVSPASLADAGLFDPAAVDSLVARARAGTGGSRALHTILGLQLWHRYFVRGRA
jgi:asparagine synthase (glutamine-hydrolysing)